MKRIPFLILLLALLFQSCDKTAQLTYEPFTGELRHAFGISTNTRTTTPIVLTRITLGDQTGYGEAALPPYLKETQESVCAFLQLAQPVINSCAEPLNVDSIMQVVNDLAPGNHAAKASIDIALHDLYGKLHGQPLWQIWNINPTATPCTSYTIGYDACDSVVLLKVREADWAKILKVKLGRSEAEDKRMINLIRSISCKPIYVDANQGWPTKEHALMMCQWLEKQGVVLIEQPMPKHMNEEHRWLCERVDLPIIADEACQTYADVAGLQPYYDGINIKLMKCGGVAEARKMITLARELGMQVMIGCMTETSAGISAAATLSPLVDYADLDGHVLLANDPYEGIQLVDGKLTLLDKPGTGVTPRSMKATTSSAQSTEYVINHCPVTPVREEPSHAAEQATQLLFGEVCEVLDCQSGWTQIRSTMDGQVGWVSSKMVSPTDNQYPISDIQTIVATPMAVATVQETGEQLMLTIGTRLPNYANGMFEILGKQYLIDDSCVYEVRGERLEVKGEDVVRVAQSLLNVPYLWGGKNIMGFDCSGFTQTVYSVFGINLLRNAREQVTQGQEVSSLAESRPGDLVFFDHADVNPEATRISHVGMLISPTEVIHCAGCVHVDKIDELGILLPNGKRTHHLVQIRRYVK